MKTYKYTYKDIERFKKRCQHCSDSDCIDFDGAKDSRGYGKFKTGNSVISAHRFAYLSARGLQQCGTLIHTCGNKWCINPAHLREGKRPGRPKS